MKDARIGNTDGKKNISYLKFPVFSHENATLTCDSAVFYQNDNVFEAFKNVHINQGDTINIYSDHLTYNGNTKIAHLTSNVRMIDKESVLTTNVLDYNMATKVGTYVEGGKIVNKDVTLTSKNGYYFSNSRDSYFRYNVVVVTPQSTIKSDTLRYNTLTNWTYFYGPTNIKGKEDNLYTENGAYNTKTEYAYFGKKNLYTNGTKSLKGDSLYYDGIAGYGKAVRNIIFKDTADKTVLYGQLGYYYKIDERAVVTKNAYVGMGTKDSITVNNKLLPDTLWLGSDTLETQMVLQKTLKLIESPVLKKNNELGEPEKPQKKNASKATALTPEELAVSKKLEKKELKEKEKADKKNSKSAKPVDPTTVKDSLLAKIPLPKDSLLKDSILQKKLDVPLIKDSLKLAKDPIKDIKTAVASKKPDSLSKKADSLVKSGNVVKKIGAVAKTTDSLLKKNVKDSIPLNPLDTIKTRSIKAYHNVRVYKSNMQATADSLFYTSADSTLRWYGNPILWSQNSQQTGDTIYLRLKNNKLNTLQVVDNAFQVNVNADSARFNQIKGKLITAFFKDGELSTMFVDGNAESVYYNRGNDSVYTDMNQTVSSRIKIIFKNKEISHILTIKEPEGIRVPITELKEDVLLTGFTWKPELRPLSKKEVISGKTKHAVSKKQTAGTVKKPGVPTSKTPAKTPDKKGINKKELVKDVSKEVIKAASKIDSTTIDSAKAVIAPIKDLITKPDTSKKARPVPLKKQ
nr:OstA-like protein [Pedobacter panaciterrae]